MQLLDDAQMRASCEALAYNRTRKELADQWMQDPEVLARAEESGFDDKTARERILIQLRKADGKGDAILAKLDSTWEEHRPAYIASVREKVAGLNMQFEKRCAELGVEWRDTGDYLQQLAEDYYRANAPSETKLSTAGEALQHLAAAKAYGWDELKLIAGQLERYQAELEEEGN